METRKPLVSSVTRAGINPYDEYLGRYNPNHPLPALRDPLMMPSGQLDPNFPEKLKRAAEYRAQIDRHPFHASFPSVSLIPNQPRYIKNTNCYALASGYAVVHEKETQPNEYEIASSIKLQPGMLSGTRPTGKTDFSCENITRLVLADCGPGKCVVDSSVRPGLKHRKVRHLDGHASMGLWVDNKGSLRDYHFAYLTKQGFVVHKPGSQPLLTVDAKGDFQTDLVDMDMNFQTDPQNEMSGFHYEFCGVIHRKVDPEDKRDKIFNQAEQGSVPGHVFVPRVGPLREYQNHPVWSRAQRV